jgi:alpha-tubulin suppressor-like RCC1 family protein
VVCWGANDTGQVGDGTFDDKFAPTPVMGLTGVAEVSAGSAHTCARRTDGSVACWGSSYNGQVGTGVSGVYATPLQVMGL